MLWRCTYQLYSPEGHILPADPPAMLRMVGNQSTPWISLKKYSIMSSSNVKVVKISNKSLITTVLIFNVKLDNVSAIKGQLKELRYYS